MTQTGSSSSGTLFANLAYQVDTAEELGILFTKALLKSAGENKLSSADGEGLVVPFAVTVATASNTGPRTADTIECYSSCWKILGHPVICTTKCITTHPDFAPGGAPPDDQTLRGLVTPGPALRNPESIQQALSKALLRTSTPMEAGVILLNSVLTILSERPDLIQADGSAELTGVATVSLAEATSATGRPQGSSSVCVESCVEIFGYQVYCHEVCHSQIQ